VHAEEALHNAVELIRKLPEHIELVEPPIWRSERQSVRQNAAPLENPCEKRRAGSNSSGL
jgi:hypothetical protein